MILGAEPFRSFLKSIQFLNATRFHSRRHSCQFETEAERFAHRYRICQEPVALAFRPQGPNYLTMKLELYPILLRFQYGTWTTITFKAHVVLKAGYEVLPRLQEQQQRISTIPSRLRNSACKQWLRATVGYAYPPCTSLTAEQQGPRCTTFKCRRTRSFPITSKGLAGRGSCRITKLL